MSKKVVYTKTHSNLHIPGIGELGNTLPSTSKSITDLKMVHEDGLLLVEGNIGVKAFSFGIPDASIAIMVFEGTYVPKLVAKVA